MKKTGLTALALAISAGSALAADLPSRKAPVIPPPPPPPMWTGFYAGLNAGGTWANNSAVNGQTWNVYSDQGFVSNGNLASAALLSGSGSNRSASGGFMGGGQIGYNWQVSGFGLGSGIVTGVEADIQGIAGSGGTASRWTAAATDNTYPGDERDFPVSLLSNQSGRSNLQYFGTVRGRLGILAMPTLLVFGTGGLAYGGVSTSIQNTQFWTDGSGDGFNYLIAGSGNLSNTQVGWTAGGGLEWMFLPNWSLKAEYLYYDLGNMTGSVVNTYTGFGDAAGESGIQSITNYSGRVSGNVVRAGVNYHFNWGAAPVVAKY
jgi:outer membrane immunogenic protein